MNMNTGIEILKRMFRHFNVRGDQLSIDVLKFALTRFIHQTVFHDRKKYDYLLRQNFFLQNLPNNKAVILYGIGSEAGSYSYALKKMDTDIVAFMDTFKQGMYYGKPIISMENYKENYADYPIVITPTGAVRTEIRALLTENGITNHLCFDIGHVEEGTDVEKIPEAKMLWERSEGAQYFSLPEITWEEDEVFVDCGAFDGETTLQFIEYCEKAGQSYDRIFCFEPDSSNFGKTSNALAGVRDVTLIYAGVGEVGAVKKFSACGSASFFGEAGTEEVQVVSLDQMLGDEKVTFIKMDIEGSELSALKGASRIIKMQKPKLAICIYHKHEDIWEIPDAIWSLCPEYNLFLRHYTDNHNETVLYAIA